MTWRGRVTGHTRGITPAEFAAMVEGHRFALREYRDTLGWQVALFLQPWWKEGETLHTVLSGILGREIAEPEEDPAQLEAEREEKRRLLRKIESAQIAKREVVGQFAGRGKK